MTRTTPRSGLALAALVAVVLIAPILIVIPMSFTAGTTITFPPDGFSLRWYRDIFTSPVWRSRIAVSVQVALGTTVLATILGVLNAFALTRWQSRWTSLLWALCLAPLVVPVVVLATGEFLVLSSGWTIGPLTIGGRLTGTVGGLVLAHTVLALPYPTVLVATSLATVDTDYEQAAASLGAGPLTTFRRITLPLIAPGVLAGAAFAFITSWDEVVMSTFLTSSRVSTVPVQIFTELRESLNPTSAAVSSLLILISLLVFVVMARMNRRNRSMEGEMR